MINTSLKPKQILVIDDNQTWLSSLEALGINVLNSSEMSLRSIEKHLEKIINSIKVVIINGHLYMGISTQRTHRIGFRIGKEALEECFPNLDFVFLSFQFRELSSLNTYCYTQFLEYLTLIKN